MFFIRRLLLIAAWACIASCARRAQQVVPCLRYGPDTTSLRGRLERLTFPGPPNFESISAGDEPETGFYLALTTPICLEANTSNEAYRGVRLVQLVLDSAGYDALRPQVGRVIRVRGRLFPSSTGHHHAPVLLEVNKPVATAVQCVDDCRRGGTGVTSPPHMRFASHPRLLRPR